MIIGYSKQHLPLSTDNTVLLRKMQKTISNSCLKRSVYVSSIHSRHLRLRREHVTSAGSAYLLEQISGYVCEVTALIGTTKDTTHSQATAKTGMDAPENAVLACPRL